MKSELENKLKKKGIKPTAMRLLIYDILYNYQKAMSLHEIEQQFNNVDRSTIFRTLKTFQNNCIIHSIDVGTGTVKYALCQEGCTCNHNDLHVHFFCNKCGKTHCLKDLPIPQIDLPDGFVFESANFIIKGICHNCQ